MGCYINPRTSPSQRGEKEAWLREFAIPCSQPSWSEVVAEQGWLPVCWVDNGMFTAAIICYKESELKEVAADIGPRPFRWYMAPIADLLEVSPLQQYLDREAAREKA